MIKNHEHILHTSIYDGITWCDAYGCDYTEEFTPHDVFDQEINAWLDTKEGIAEARRAEWLAQNTQK